MIRNAIFRFLRALCFSAAALSAASTFASAATYGDFGYESRKPPVNPMPTLLLVLNFADAPIVDPDPNRTALEFWTDFVFDPNFSDGISTDVHGLNGFLDVNSRGSFQLKNAGAYQINLQANEHFEYLGNPNYWQNIMARAFAMGFRGQDYAGSDGWVDQSELLVIYLHNFEGGNIATFMQPAPPGSEFLGWNGTIAQARHGYDSDGYGSTEEIYHEIGHLMQIFRNSGTVDLYGQWKFGQDMNIGLSLMSSGLVHFDGWHKLQFGWTRPNAYSLRQNGSETLWAQQHPFANQVILYDPSSPSGFNEFFLLEYRADNTTTNSSISQEAGLPGSGLLIWHVYQENGKKLLEWKDLVHPTSNPKNQGNFNKCRYCRALVHEDDLNKPCPGNTPGHERLYEISVIVVVRDDPSEPGRSGFRRCGKCGMFFHQDDEAQSVCPDDGKTHSSSGSANYTLWMNPASPLGSDDWRICNKCRTLYEADTELRKEYPPQNGVTCAAGGLHSFNVNDPMYVLIHSDNPTLMNEGAPGFIPGGNQLWGSGEITPEFHSFTGTPLGVSAYVRDHMEGSDSIVVDWIVSQEIWVDFSHSGFEAGTFEFPFNTLVEGINALEPGWRLRIKAGSTSETGSFGKRMKVDSYGGKAVIGQ